MARFKVEAIRTRGKEGRLLEAGARWTEPNGGGIVASIGLFCLIAGVVYYLLEPPAVILLALLLIASIVIAVTRSRRPRALIFTADGKMLTPNGQPFRSSRYRYLDGHHQAITSIEATAKSYRDELQTDSRTRAATNVSLISSAGETVHMARDLTPEDARNVAVQLTLALEAIRGESAPAVAGARGRLTDPRDDLIE